MSSQGEHFTSNAQSVRMRAAGWLQRQQFWNWSAQDQAELDDWLAQSPSHLAAYLRVKTAWGRTERLAALRINSEHAIPVAPRRGLQFFSRAAAALVLIAAFGVAGARYIAGTNQTTWVTPVGGHRMVLLGDGSQVELNTDTVLRVAGDRREAWLDRGEAYFQIKHDLVHPFVVNASGHRVTDLGTKFLVRNDPRQLEVTLISGRARIDSTAPGVRGAILAPGDTAVAGAASISVVRKSLAKVMGQLGWRQGLLNFDNATLADVAEELNRYNRAKLIIADPKIARLTIDASIPTHGIQAFTRVARDFLGLRVDDRGDEIVISR